MTPAARIAATIELITSIMSEARPADGITNSYFRARRFIGSKDRSAISSQVYGIIRHRARLQWRLAQYKIEQTPRVTVLTYLLDIEGLSKLDIESTFSGEKFAPQSLTPDERNSLHHLAAHPIKPNSMPEAVRAECPDWAAAGLKERFGNDFVTELSAMLIAAPMDLRVNAMKGSREDVLRELETASYAAEPCPYAPYGIRMKDRPSLSSFALLKDGTVEIQDEGSQLAALLVDAKPGQRVVDFCAGAAGKALAIAAQMNNKGHVIACDTHAKRLTQGKTRIRRAGFHNIETRVLASESDPWVKKHKEGFDRVLVDAPCSGTGTWRRNPDARWSNLGPGLENLVPLQARILQSASRLVKKGGRLIYATCSMLPQENDEQIAAFIKANPNFRVVDYRTIMTENAPCAGPYLSLTPRQHNTDGFFGAVMEKDFSTTGNNKPTAD